MTAAILPDEPGLGWVTYTSFEDEAIVGPELAYVPVGGHGANIVDPPIYVDASRIRAFEAAYPIPAELLENLFYTCWTKFPIGAGGPIGDVLRDAHKLWITKFEGQL